MPCAKQTEKGPHPDALYVIRSVCGKCLGRIIHCALACGICGCGEVLEHVLGKLGVRACRQCAFGSRDSRKGFFNSLGSPGGFSESLGCPDTRLVTNSYPRKSPHETALNCSCHRKNFGNRGHNRLKSLCGSRYRPGSYVSSCLPGCRQFGGGYHFGKGRADTFEGHQVSSDAENISLGHCFYLGRSNGSVLGSQIFRGPRE